MFESIILCSVFIYGLTCAISGTGSSKTDSDSFESWKYKLDNYATEDVIDRELKSEGYGELIGSSRGRKIEKLSEIKSRRHSSSTFF